MEPTSAHGSPLIWAVSGTAVMRHFQTPQVTWEVRAALSPRADEEGQGVMRHEGRASRTDCCYCW